VIINADDFGLSDGVTRGIVAAHRAGAVTSTSMFANAPGFAGAVRAARENPTLDVGLHLNLTAGAPVTPPAHIPTLCGADGQFLALSRLVGRALRARIDPGDVERECRAQLDRLTAERISVTHLDGHRHVHVLPGVWPGILAVAREAGIPSIRVPMEPLTGGRASAKIGLAWVTWLGARGASVPGRVCRFRGIGLLGTTRFGEGLLRILDRLPRGTTEIMVHPGYADADLLGWDPYVVERERELAALRSPEVLARLTRSDLRLVRFADL
jgi:chitin disaccharide deacetylase